MATTSEIKDINNELQFYYELHPYDMDISIIDAGSSFFLHLLQHLLVKTGLRKMAKIKEIEDRNYELFVQCPYCDGVTYQRSTSRRYQCIYCKRKSYIILGPAGVFMAISTKRINDPQMDNITEEEYNTKYQNG